MTRFPFVAVHPFWPGYHVMAEPYLTLCLPLRWKHEQSDCVHLPTVKEVRLQSQREHLHLAAQHALRRAVQPAAELVT